MSGCRTCEHRYVHVGFTKCDLKPHDYETIKQMKIVNWLSKNQDAFNAPGCPSYVEFVREDK